MSGGRGPKKKSNREPSAAGSGRKARVEHAIREALTEMIAADIKDPRVHAPTMLTVTKVELNVDMAVANCYVSIVGDDAVADAAIEGLTKAAGFLRGPIGRRLGLQHAPELRFLADATIDMSAKIAAILRDDEERARAAGREPTPVAPVAPTPKKEPAS
ncbi:MAG: ribosome-binding factor [Myxococcales bacterium]|nr:ribosome-binding factor [Myxococcales bacterium]